MFTDSFIRAYAVQEFDYLASDNTLTNYMLQLTQGECCVVLDCFECSTIKIFEEDRQSYMYIYYFFFMDTLFFFFFSFSHFLIFFNHNTTKSFAALKAEPFHDSALARFLLRRSIANPARVGHCFYWALAADCHIKGCAHRFELLKNTYLR